MLKVVGIFFGLVLGLGLICANFGQNLGRRIGAEVVQANDSSRRQQALVPKETMEQRRIRHMSYFDSKLYRQNLGRPY